ncbi:MAG: M3 family metallopeptidase [Saccharofermentanales bacterium]
MDELNQAERWDLDSLYAGLSDPSFVSDQIKMQELAEKGSQLLQLPLPDRLSAGLEWWEEQHILRKKIFPYLILRNSEDSSDLEVRAELKRYRQYQAAVDLVIVGLKKTIAEVNLAEFLAVNPHWRDYEFFLKQIQIRAERLLTEETERLLSAVTNSSVQNWVQLISDLTSQQTIIFDGKTIGLGRLNALQKDTDRNLRQRAYQKELEIYAGIELPAAYALNSIKSYAAAMAKTRGYSEALAETLSLSRLKRETLDSLLQTVRQYLPLFQQFLQAKSRLISGRNQIAWYDLWAPVGESRQKFSPQEAEELIVNIFSDLHPPLSRLIKRAFEEHWIDFYPRLNKTGGSSFCFNLPMHCQSRILTNFTGDLGSVKTLVHELGHAYHGSIICQHRPLNQEYTLPLAETASTFNETHFYLALLECQQEAEERISLLNDCISAAVLFICDMYARFCFEQEVFKACEQRFLAPATLCRLMSDAQREAYGEALDPGLDHPYQWIAKDHYYSLRVNYYNFPYTFGTLFAVGLYHKFRQEGTDFMAKYDRLLAGTATSSCEDAALSIGLDLTTEDFWLESLSHYADLIREFLRLA